jgi:hypothetical protein
MEIMFTFATMLGASGTLIASGVAEKILLRYGKEDLATTLRTVTYFSAFGYGIYICIKVVQVAAGTFLGIF